MNKELDVWILEMVKKKTFQNRSDAIEFCVGATRAFCEVNKLNQEEIKRSQTEGEKQNPKIIIPLSFPLKWSKKIDIWIREQGRNPTIARPTPEPTTPVP
jgi:Arc/MetJ-type ribon-helix-helix transcriptional regulator